MSCDGNRQRLFGALAPLVAPLVGSEVGGRELLDTLFDVASQQPPPQDKAGQLAAAAAYQKLNARAAREGINLYPHRSKSGLPAPEAVAAWAQVGALLDAVGGGGGTSLPPLAADVQQAVALQTALGQGATRWGATISGVSMVALRQCWAADLGRVESLLLRPDSLGDEAHTPWLRGLTEQLAADARLDPALAAAARQYLVLDEEGVLEPAQRAGWARVLAGLAGVGIGPSRAGGRRVCQRCGRYEGLRHRCAPVDQAVGARVAVAVAELLADPLQGGSTPEPSPFVTATRLLGDWMCVEAPAPPEGAMGRLLAAMRAADRAQVQGMAEAVPVVASGEIDRRWLRDATLRAPLVFAGERYVWDDEVLYPEAAYRRIADWGQWASAAVTLTPVDERVNTGIGVLDAASVVQCMAGKRVAPERLKLDRALWAGFFETSQVRAAQVAKDDVVAEPCGCLYTCISRPKPGEGGQLQLRRLAMARGGCFAHGVTQWVAVTDMSPMTRIDPRRPRFPMPTWPALTGEPPQSVPQPPEAPDVV